MMCISTHCTQYTEEGGGKEQRSEKWGGGRAERNKERFAEGMKGKRGEGRCGEQGDVKEGVGKGGVMEGRGERQGGVQLS